MNGAPTGRSTDPRRCDDRGQFVLLAGVVVAIALVAMLTAYLQLGYGADVTAGSADRSVQDSTAYLERITHQETRPLRGEYRWAERAEAISATRNRLQPRLETLERSRVTEGVVSQASFNASAADAAVGRHCSSGPGRAFGPCAADRGVIVQERADRTLVLAVAYDLNVTTEAGTTSLTTVVNATN